MIKKKTRLCFILTIVLVFSTFSFNFISVFAAPSYFIELEKFRWTKSTLKILVDMNKWSIPDYASAVREALSSWMTSIWTYSNSFNDTILKNINYIFYLSSVNSTNSFDVHITFTANETSPNIVGITRYKWNPLTHNPITPISVEITTYSAKANHLFVKNIAMHEFGHVLGLGHASSQKTRNGYELMYYSAPLDHSVYPSTLDLYGLTILYKGNFNQLVQLPSYIPYETVIPTTNTPPDITQPSAGSDLNQIMESVIRELSAIIGFIWENSYPNLIILVFMLLFLIVLSTVAFREQENKLRAFFIYY